MTKTTNIKCINVVGFSDVGKTTVLRKLALLINDSITWLSDSVLISNKFKFAVILEGDTVPIIKRHFCILKREKIDYILCTSHTGDTLEHIYSELVNLGLFKNNIDAKNSTLLVFKEGDCKHCNSIAICSNLPKKERAPHCMSHNDAFVKKLKDLVSLHFGVEFKNE